MEPKQRDPRPADGARRSGLLASLRARLPGRRRLVWTVAALVALPFVLVGVGLALAGTFGVRLHLDPALVLLGLAALVLAWTVGRVVRHWLTPRPAVTVGFRFELSQPQLPLGRYLFRLEVFYDVEQRGQRRTLEQGTVEMRFRRRDHPEPFEWCRKQIAAQVARHRRLAGERWPGARVLASPVPSAQELAHGYRLRP